MWYFSNSYYNTEKKDDETEESNNNNNNAIIDYYNLKNVKEHKKYRTKEKISRVSKARIYQYILCWPSTTSYINIVGNNMITNCDISSYEIKKADIIWEPTDYIFKGKTKIKN